ncbi:MAG: hypothetical protein ABIY55_09490 [Kofleriaceae bacterium]
MVGEGARQMGGHRTKPPVARPACPLYPRRAIRAAMSDPPPDDQMTVQFERIVRRVKQSMNYRGSYSTRDILDSLVTRWLQSGEWDRLRCLAPEDRHIGESVRRFIIDRFDQLRRRGPQAQLDEAVLAIPDDATLTEIVELAEMRRWIFARVAELEAGRLDARVAIPLTNARQIGQALRSQLDGRTQREIAFALGSSLGAVNKWLVQGTNYLVVLQGIEQGLGGG